MAYCCAECAHDFLLPWEKKYCAPNVVVEVEHQFRGRINSETSIAQMEVTIPMEIVTQQPQVDNIELDKPRHHKKSVSSLDSALLASSSGILNQILKVKKPKKGQEGPLALLSFIYEQSCGIINIFEIQIRNYNSIFFLNTATNFSRDGSENSPLLTSSPSLILRINIEPMRNQIMFTSVLSRSKSPIWKESMALKVDKRNIAEQAISVTLYESNRFSRWTAVRTGRFSLKDFNVNGTHNLSLDMEPINTDLQAYGEIRLGFYYNKTTNRILCDVIDARSLFQWALNKKTEYYVKIQFFDGKRQIKIKKTAAMRPDASSLMEINETIHAKIAIAGLNSLNIKVSVCDGKQIMGDSSLYHVIFGDDGSSGPLEFTYWADFIRDIPSVGRNQWFSLKPK